MSNKDLIIKEISNSPLVKKEYKAMLNNITSSLPAIKQSSSNFYKSHSQFMGVMLDVTAITPIRSVKHTLAELNKTRMALEEAQLKMMKKEVELRQKEKELIGIKHLLDYQPKELYHLIEYKDLVKHPRKTIDGKYEFLGIPNFKHRFINLNQFEVNGMKYDDAILGEGLHTVKTDAIYKDTYDVYSIIPKSIIDKYKQCNFWKG